MDKNVLLPIAVVTEQVENVNDSDFAATAVKINQDISAGIKPGTTHVIHALSGKFADAGSALYGAPSTGPYKRKTKIELVDGADYSVRLVTEGKESEAAVVDVSDMLDVSLADFPTIPSYKTVHEWLKAANLAVAVKVCKEANLDPTSRHLDLSFTRVLLKRWFDNHCTVAIKVNACLELRFEYHITGAFAWRLRTTQDYHFEVSGK